MDHSFLLPPEEADEIGRLGHYRVLRLLGEGGMGFVFLAEDATLRRRVALKVMKPEPSKPNRAQRFFREAQALARLKHEHLVPVYHAEQQGDIVFYAMELLEGESLGDRLLRKEPFEVPEIVRVGREVAAGLAFIHQQGLIHRDIKPPNIWLEAPHGRVKILDLGLVRAIDEDIALTQAGIVVGSVGFMSPEQARGEAIDGRSDLFSLGCVLYHLCTRVPAFAGVSAVAVLTALAVRKPRPVQELNDDIPQPLAKLVMELLAKNPNQRPQSADEVRERLERMAQRAATVETPKASKTAVAAAPRPRKRERPPRRREASAERRTMMIVGLGVAGAVVCALAGLCLWLFWPSPSSTAPAVAVPGPAGPVDQPANDKKLGETTYLADLPPLGKKNWLPPGDGENAAKVLTKDGKASAHAIFMAVPREADGPASISYQLNKQFTSFQTEVAAMDGRPRGADSFSKKSHFLKKSDGPVKSSTSCVFSVYGDGNLLWQSHPVSGPHDAQSCTVSVKGVDVLKIEATAHGRDVNAAWVEPFLRK